MNYIAYIDMNWSHDLSKWIRKGTRVQAMTYWHIFDWPRVDPIPGNLFTSQVVSIIPMHSWLSIDVSIVGSVKWPLWDDPQICRSFFLPTLGHSHCFFSLESLDTREIIKFIKMMVDMVFLDFLTNKIFLFI